MANNFSTRILTLSGQIITATPSSLLVNGLAIQGGSSTASGAVYTTGDQTISGNKTFTGVSYFNSGAFSNRPTVNGTGVLLSGETSLFQTQIGLPSGINSFANIGKIAINNAGYSLGVSATVSEGGYAVSKFYNINAKFDGNYTWRELLPSFNSGPYNGNDFVMDISGLGNDIDLRLRNKTITHSGIVNINIFDYLGAGYPNNYIVFTRNTTTGTDNTALPLTGFQGTTYLTGYFLNGLTVSGNGLNVFGPTALSGNANVNGALTVSGHFSANTKSFLIDHPTIPGKKLQYGSLESPYHGIRLTAKNKVKNGLCQVKLPEYIKGLIHQEEVNIQITNINHDKILYVKDIDINNNYFIIGCNNEFDFREYEFYWSFTAVRKDVDPLIVEH